MPPVLATGSNLQPKDGQRKGKSQAPILHAGNPWSLFLKPLGYAHPVKPGRISLTLISKPAELQQKASALWIEQVTGTLAHFASEADSIPKVTLPGLSFPIEPNDQSLWPRGPPGTMQPSPAPSVHRHTPDHTSSDPCPGTGRHGAHSVELIPRAPLHGISPDEQRNHSGSPGATSSETS